MQSKLELIHMFFHTNIDSIPKFIKFQKSGGDKVVCRKKKFVLCNIMRSFV